jgi:hypothetical protein
VLRGIQTEWHNSLGNNFANAWKEPAVLVLVLTVASAVGAARMATLYF